MKTKQLIKLSMVAAASVMLYTSAFAAGTAKALSDTALAASQMQSYGTPDLPVPDSNGGSGVAVSRITAMTSKDICLAMGGAWNSTTKQCKGVRQPDGLGPAVLTQPVSISKVVPVSIHNCKGGQYYSSTQKKCVAFGSEKIGHCSKGTIYNGSNCVTDTTAQHNCFQGQYYSTTQKKCVNDGSENLGKCPVGSVWDSVKCVSSSVTTVSTGEPLATGPGPVITGTVGTMSGSTVNDTAKVSDT
jgi:type II secretory pathway pseudopilin PulG